MNPEEYVHAPPRLLWGAPGEIWFGFFAEKCSPAELLRRSAMCKQEGGGAYRQVRMQNGGSIGWFVIPRRGEPLDSLTRKSIEMNLHLRRLVSTH